MTANANNGTWPPVEERPAFLTLATLEQALRAADARVFLVLPRILRRVIREHCELGGWGWQTPHRKSYTIDRLPLLRIVDLDELGAKSIDGIPERVILLPQPVPEHLAGLQPDDVLTEYWRLLFHAQVHLALEDRIARGGLDGPALRNRVQRIGATAFDEIRAVLQQERLLLPPGDERTAYVEFAAVYTELRRFAPSFLERYFPAIEHPEAIDAILAEDVDAEALFASSRPLGAPLPHDVLEPEELDEWAPTPETVTDEPVAMDLAQRPSERKCRRLLRRADRAAAVGNLVRAMTVRTKAERVATLAQLAEVRAALRSDLRRLVQRLQAALEMNRSDTPAWRDALAALVRRAPRGIWNAEARLLYDLQKVCVDAEREIETVDLIEWIRSFGRRPIRRPLPHQRDILMSKHLLIAAKRMPAVRLSGRHRQELSTFLRAAIKQTEERTRRLLRPQLTAALDEVGLVPENVPEQVARKKVVEVVLDRIVERGFAKMGDFRDALSRNNLKLADLPPLAEIPAPQPLPETPPPGFWGRLRYRVDVAAQRALDTAVGRSATRVYRSCRDAVRSLVRRDQLLRADHLLATSLDGVYRPGEIYLRWMQHITSVLFATPRGRFFTLFVAVPFGGAYLAYAGVGHLVEMVHKWSGAAQAAAETTQAAAEIAQAGTEAIEGKPEIHIDFQHLWQSIDWNGVAIVCLLGVFLLGLVNYTRFRSAVWEGLKLAFRAVRSVLLDLPRWLMGIAWVRRILESAAAKAVWRYGLKPAIVTAAIWPVFSGVDPIWWRALLRAGLLFAGINLVLNSRAGRNIEEMTVDWVVQAWHRFGLRLLLNLFSLVMEISRELLEAVERLLYTVDEWLRFKSGESAITLWMKAALGAVWFFVTYVVRFCVNLLIEPQINPIKHFPVVTVSHKLLLPTIPYLATVLQYTLDRPMSWTAATAIIFSIPGIFGFLVWELKENWRLYGANRGKMLPSAIVGDHGETMPRLLKRGFHSGVLPKRYAKLRRAERRARLKGDWKAVRKHLHALHHVERDVRRYIDRELLGLLEESDAWQDLVVCVEEIHVGPNVVRIALQCLEMGEEPLVVAFEVRSSWLLVGVVTPGWAARLDPQQRAVLADALLGLYKTAGVDLVHEQVEAALPAASSYGLCERGLVVWPDAAFKTEVVYDLQHEGRQFHPEVVAGTPRETLPELDRDRILFREIPITWDRWVATWQEDAAGGRPAPVVPVPVLPEQVNEHSAGCR
jgi:hypothetical protein